MKCSNRADAARRQPCLTCALEMPGLGRRTALATQACGFSGSALPVDIGSQRWSTPLRMGQSPACFPRCRRLNEQDAGTPRASGRRRARPGLPTPRGSSSGRTGPPAQCPIQDRSRGALRCVTATRPTPRNGANGTRASSLEGQLTGQVAQATQAPIEPGHLYRRGGCVPQKASNLSHRALPDLLALRTRRPCCSDVRTTLPESNP